MNRMLLSALSVLAMTPALVSHAEYKYIWSCVPFGSADGPALWIAENGDRSAQVNHLREACGSSRLTRHFCFRSAGALIAEAQIVKAGVADEVASYSWDGDTFTIVSDRRFAATYAGRFEKDPRSYYSCKLENPYIPQGPQCGCNGADIGTEVCRGIPHGSCH